MLKFLCALLVVYIHTYCFEPGWGWIKEVLSSVGVPFFFIVSGFFLGKGLRKSESPKDYLVAYNRRLIPMYLGWTLLTLPVAWMNLCYVHSDFPWWWTCAHILRCFVFTGSLGIYWYVLSLIYNSVIIYYCERKGLLKWLFAISIPFFVLGVLYEAGTLANTPLGDFIHVVIGSERNFLNVGLIYMCIGYLFSRVKRWKGKWLWLVCLSGILLLEYYQLACLPYRFLQMPAAVLLFLFGVQWQPNISDNLSKTLRKWSTVIYLSHFPFILVFDFYLKRGTLIDYPMAIAFSLVSYYLLIKILPERISRMLYGA